MSKMDENHRYHPYSREKNHSNDRRYDDDDYRRPYKKTNKHHYQYHDNRNYNDFSYRRSHRNDYRYQQSNSRSYFSTPPPPLMSTSIPSLPPSPPPPPPPPLLTVVPHERESWSRSVKKTKTNESTEQKTQYLETMLRMPQQKSLLNTSRFDRMRFADNQLSTSTTTTSANNDHFDQSSFHLVDDVNHHDDIRTLEKILFDNEIQQQQQQNTTDECSNRELLPTPPSSVIECEATVDKHATSLPCSGFLIDDCDEEEELPPLSPPPRPLLPPLSEDVTQQNDEDIDGQRAMLVSELETAATERKRQKRLRQKLQKKKQVEAKTEKQPIISTTDNEQHESLSDWILEYDNNETDQVSQLTDEVRRTSIAMTNEDKTAKVNLILMKIKKQQQELNRLRQYVMSMLGEQETSKSSKNHRHNSSMAHDLLMAFLNQPVKSGCWLCSGKTYAEVATQCDHDNDE